MIIPIFVLIKDRLTVLKIAILSWINTISAPVEIILIDNGSTYPPMLEFLKSGKLPVIWNKIGIDLVNRPAEFGINWGFLIDEYLNRLKSKPEFYIVSDPDIAFDTNRVPDDILEMYIFLLNRYPLIECVGPMLDIDDLPDHYPLKESVIDSHTKQFWQRKRHEITFKDRIVEYQNSIIDTTFAMYRSNFHYRRHVTKAIRTYAPYSAKHLDWYIDPDNMTDDQKYYLATCNSHGGKSHWGGARLKEALKNSKK